ncbi:MAG: thiamine phosphate synthase [Candidatus Omnitrophica bacterium]|nr:thiamine phosphate synthase [Candidatus Omnitrophota bacterium]
MKNFRLYAVTDLREPDAGFLARAEKALRGGVDVLQLRSKSLSDAELLRVGSKLRRLTAKHRRIFIVNDRLDLAIALGADGVHLGQDDLPVAVARKILRDRSKIIGKSTHSLGQALRAAEEGADYIGVGPVFSTPTKPSYEPVGLDLVREVSRKIKVPFVAIGGIDADNLPQVLEAGARRVAVVRAVFRCDDPYASAQRLKKAILQHALPLLQV